MSGSSGENDERGKPGRDSDTSEPAAPEPDFHGAAIIDEEGHEIPITEDMIKDACEKLDRATADADADEKKSDS